MLNFLNPEAPSPTPQEIARSFRWLGWGGFALQILMGFAPILVVITNVLFGTGRAVNAFSFGLLLAIICAAILLFSIYWSFRYIRIGNYLEDPGLRPPKSRVIRDLKLGVLANFGIMTLATLIALSRVSGLTFQMLTVPQGATVITPGQIGTTVNPGALITPSNMIAIQAMVSAIAAGLVGAAIALVLLYLVGQHRNP